MHINRIIAESLHIPFRSAFEHSSASREETAAVLVKLTTVDSVTGYGEGCPRAYVTGETVADSLVFINKVKSTVMESISDIESLRNWIISNKAVIDQHPAAWCAIELAVLDALGKSNHKPVEAILDLPLLDGKFLYSAVLGVSNDKAFDMMLSQYHKAGFSDYKLKLCGDVSIDRSHIKAVRERNPTARIRVDANNLWQTADEAMVFFEALDEDLFAIEEPLNANDITGMSRLAALTSIPIILDESCLRVDQVSDLPAPAGNWIINIRISKMGGLIRSLQVLAAAREKNIRVVIGAQVGETSILTRAALTLANSARDLLLAQEGAFGNWLLESDVCEQPLMFAAKGILEEPVMALAGRDGLGLEINSRNS